MARASWNDTILAEATPDAIQIVEGNVYFPPEAVRSEYLRPSETHTICGWKGTASYYDVVVGDAVNRDAAWYYPETLEAANHVRGFVAFWNGITVQP